jgi:nucleotide-binding universal stress UspA family protein
MYKKILLAGALQHWERYSVHALAAREVAAELARHAERLHVLSVYDYELPTSELSGEMVARLREQYIQQTDQVMAQKMDEYVAPLVNRGIAVSKIIRLGSPRHVIVEVASEIEADLLVIGSHSKRGLLDIALGDTARHVSTHAPCTVVMVAPKK